MPVLIALLRGVNIGGHHKIKMDVLRCLCESLGFQNVQTHLQSGNVIFRACERNLAKVSERIQSAIEHKVAFRPDVLLRSIPELRDVVARNPFAKRPGLEPSKLAVTFFAEAPSRKARENVLKLKADPEDMRVDGREMYTYFPNGMARPTISWSVIERLLRVPLTSRNWNTVTKLLELGESLESAGR